MYLNLPTDLSGHQPKPHHWLKNIHISFVPGENTTPLVHDFARDLLDSFSRMGNVIQKAPDQDTNVLLTSAQFNHAISWRQSLMFTGRARYGLAQQATVFCVIEVKPDILAQTLNRLDAAIRKSPPDPADFAFRGLEPKAYEILYEQGKRGGAILALERILQGQSKTIHILLLVGEGSPQYVYHFDLVGAHPRTFANQMTAFFDEIALRMLTCVSTSEVTSHLNNQEHISPQLWRSLSTPQEMINASRELGRRSFFTEPVLISKLIAVPAISESVASQYSEGCFATWDPILRALVSTITGSTRPVVKSEINEDDLAVITGLRSDKLGVVVRHVEGKRNDPPSSEAVEMVLVDNELPWIELPASKGTPCSGVNVMVPVIRSKLHGHRGISAYNPERVEFVPLDSPFYGYPVTCATEAQAIGIQAAFSRSESLLNPDDPRMLVFTVLPTHGMIVAEKWVSGAAPFETIWKAMDIGDLEVSNQIPQGRFRFETNGKMMVLKQPGEDGKYA